MVLFRGVVVGLMLLWLIFLWVDLRSVSGVGSVLVWWSVCVGRGGLVELGTWRLGSVKDKQEM